MPTQYTPILQLALPVTGELNGTWGDVVNDNITSMVEEAIAGLATISTWTANAHTLTTADGTTDEARCAMLLLQTGSGGTALSAAGQVICPAQTKMYVVKNDAAYAVTIKTSGGSGVSVSAGDTVFVFCDGTNVNACVTQIVNGHITGNLTVDGNTTLGNSTSDTITATARFASDLNPSADNTYDLGTSSNSWRNANIEGTATIGTASLTNALTTANGGTGLSSYTAGDIVYYASGTALTKLGIGTSTYILTSTGSAPQWTAPSSISINTATNIAGGLANQIVYQSGPGATTFITAPSVANTYLNWSGSAFQWSVNPLGTVTSVDVSGGTTGLTTSGGPITTSGTITFAGTLNLANGGTGATTVAGAQTNLQVDPAGTAVAMAIALG